MKKIVGFLIFFISIAFSATAIDKIELSERDRKDAIKLMQDIRKKIEKEEKEKALELKRKQKEEEARQKEEARQREIAEKEAQKLQKEAEAKLREEQAKAAREFEERKEKAVEETMDAMDAVAEEVETKNMEKESSLEAYLKDKKRIEKEKKAQIKTPMEKLEATQKLANEKVDFYERVGRSVAREEKEVKEYKEILNSEI